VRVVGADGASVATGESGEQERGTSSGGGAMARRESTGPGIMQGMMRLPHLAMPPSLWRDPFGIVTRSGGFGLADRLLHDLEDDMRQMSQAILGERGGQEEEQERGLLGGADLERLWAAVDVKETSDAFELSTDVPGLTENDVKVTVDDNNVLRIDGERRLEEETEEAGFKRIERSFGSFERRFKLPAGVNSDDIQASMRNGVLSIRVPKKEQQQAQEPKKIHIQSSEAAK
jgi:HSP20 family protein